MNRDLVFFVAGLCFGAAAGYFGFRAASSEAAPGAAATASVAESPIGLDRAPEREPVDEGEVERLTAAAEERPDDASVRERLGRVYLDAGRFGEAVRWLESAVALAPEDLETRTALALAYLNEGRLDETVATYEESLRLAPEHPGSLLGLGRVRLYLQQDIDGGLALWKRLVAVAPGSEEAASVRDELEALSSAHPGS